MEVRATVGLLIFVLLWLWHHSSILHYLAHSRVRRTSFYAVFRLRLQFHDIYMILRSCVGCGDSFSLDTICVRWIIPPRRPFAVAVLSLRWRIAAPASSKRVRRGDDDIPDFKFDAFTTTHTRLCASEYKCKRDHTPTTRDYCCADRASILYPVRERSPAKLYNRLRFYRQRFRVFRQFISIIRWGYCASPRSIREFGQMVALFIAVTFRLER